MRRYHKRSVQLTSLLDLLFIMVFIALMMEPPVPKSDSPDPKAEALFGVIDDLNEKIGSQAQEIDSLKAELKKNKNNQESEKSDDKGFYKRLFLANMYFVQRNWNKPNIALNRFNRKTYGTTSLILGDQELGFLRSVLLRKGSSASSQAKPVTLDGVGGEVQSCNEVIISRAKLSQTCTRLGQTRIEQSCERVDATHYYCRIKHTNLNTNKENHWHSLREVIKFYDLSLK